MDENKEAIKKYGMLHEYHDNEEYLMKNPHLACEYTANYLVIWCIDLEVEEVRNLLFHRGWIRNRYLVFSTSCLAKIRVDYHG